MNFVFTFIFTHRLIMNIKMMKTHQTSRVNSKLTVFLVVQRCTEFYGKSEWRMWAWPSGRVRPMGSLRLCERGSVTGGGSLFKAVYRLLHGPKHDRRSDALPASPLELHDPDMGRKLENISRLCSFFSLCCFS